jgi:hypothetical protein
MRAKKQSNDIVRTTTRAGVEPHRHALYVFVRPRPDVPLYISLYFRTIRDNGIQTDKEIQNPVSEPKFAAHTPNLFAF